MSDKAPEPPYNPMKSVEMLRWIEQGRETAVSDGRGNKLCLIELLAQHVFNDLIVRSAAADVSLTGLSLVALSSVRNLGVEVRSSKTPIANYGVPAPIAPPKP